MTATLLILIAESAFPATKWLSHLGNTGENGRGMGRAGLPFITTIRGQPNSKAEAIHPFLGLLANFATGPAGTAIWPGELV